MLFNHINFLDRQNISAREPSSAAYMKNMATSCPQNTQSVNPAYLFLSQTSLFTFSEDKTAVDSIKNRMARRWRRQRRHDICTCLTSRSCSIVSFKKKKKKNSRMQIDCKDLWTRAKYKNVAIQEQVWFYIASNTWTTKPNISIVSKVPEFAVVTYHVLY